MRHAILILSVLSVGTLYAAPIVLPSTPTATIGATVQFTSTDTVTWSMAPGSAGSISAGGLFTATTTFFTAKVSRAGCQTLPNDHALYIDVSNLPVHSSSTARLANLTAVLGQQIHLGWDVSFPPNVVSNQTPTQNLIFRYTPNNNGPYPIWPFPYRGEESTILPNNPFAQDHHIFAVSTDTCKYFELYGYYNIGTNPGCPTCNSSSGLQYDAMSYALPDTAGGSGGATDAAGLPAQPLSVSYPELISGNINHAMRFSLDNGNIYSGFAWPAVAFTNECSNHAICFPYGSWLRLKASYVIPTTLSVPARAIYTAAKKHGIILADGGTAGHIQMMADATADTTTWNALWNELTFISSVTVAQDFEEIDPSSLMISSASGRVNLSNPYVVPDNFAQVIATKNSDSSTSTVNVAIQVPTVGTYNLPFFANSAGIQVMAGTPQFQIPLIINGSTDTVATCSMSPTIGTLTSGCAYTAPTSFANQLATATVTITPRVSSANSFNFPLVIYSSDGIRIHGGSKTGANPYIPPINAVNTFGPDASGYYWFNDPVGTLPNFYSRSDIYFPESSWPSSTTVSNIGLFYSHDFGQGDKVWSAMVPNGSYLLTMGFGVDNNAAAVANSTNTLDSQGVIFASSVNLVNAQYTPNIITTTITVTNNQFYWAIRGNNESSFSSMSMWSLTPTAIPAITSSLTASGVTGSPFTYQITASNNPTSYGASPLPAGLSINTGTGVISGAPTTPGTTNTIISATNVSGTGPNTCVISVTGQDLSHSVNMHGTYRIGGNVTIKTR